MDLQHFEQAILKLAFETDARITTAAVAYYLGIPSREANRLLNALLEEGVLELDSDSSGNLYYRVPHHSDEADGTGIGAIKQLRAKKDAESRPNPVTTAPPENHAPSSAHFGASIDEDPYQAQPGLRMNYNPVVASVGRADGAGVHPGRRHEPVPPPPPQTTTARDSWGGFDDYYDPGAGLDGSPSGQRTAARVKPDWTSVASRVASPDASLNRCGSSPMVVSTQVRCEPRPLPAEKPMIVSCADAGPALEKGREQLWFGRPAESTALVEVGETALAREYYIEQPEHQPGMALLLSLILCGTGQIYNGEISKGIMMMILCFLLWFVLLGWVVHIWSIVDAVVVAERLNRKQA